MQTSIGVRKLVEFTLKRGNLISSVNSQNTALDGINIHQQLQKKFSKDTKAEFSLKKEYHRILLFARFTKKFFHIFYFYANYKAKHYFFAILIPVLCIL